MDNISMKELAFNEEHAYATRPGNSSGTSPAREKAIITIGRQVGAQSIKLGVTIILTDEYSHGTTDLVALSSAMEMFQKAAGQQVAEICRSEGIVLLNKSHAAEPAQASQTSSTTTFTTQQPVSLPYLPASTECTVTQRAVTRDLRRCFWKESGGYGWRVRRARINGQLK
jgi:hypothetical protein